MLVLFGPGIPSGLPASVYLYVNGGPGQEWGRPPFGAELGGPLPVCAVTCGCLRPCFLVTSQLSVLGLEWNDDVLWNVFALYGKRNVPTTQPLRRLLRLAARGYRLPLLDVRTVGTGACKASHCSKNRLTFLHKLLSRTRACYKLCSAVCPGTVHLWAEGRTKAALGSVQDGIIANSQARTAAAASICTPATITRTYNH